MYKDRVKSIYSNLPLASFVTSFIMFVIILLISIVYSEIKEPEIKTYSLMPVDGNKYVICTPIEDSGASYEAITVCINNKIYNLKGDVDIDYVDKYSSMVYESKMGKRAKYFIKTPRNTVEFKAKVVNSD